MSSSSTWISSFLGRSLFSLISAASSDTATVSIYPESRMLNITILPEIVHIYPSQDRTMWPSSATTYLQHHTTIQDTFSNRWFWLWLPAFLLSLDRTVYFQPLLCGRWLQKGCCCHFLLPMYIIMLIVIYSYLLCIYICHIFHDASTPLWSSKNRNLHFPASLLSPSHVSITIIYIFLYLHWHCPCCPAYSPPL